MSKELEALKRIKKMYEYFVKENRDLEPKLMICEKEDFKIIETTLKRLEVFDKIEELPTPQIINNNDGSYGVEGADDFLFVSKNAWEKKSKAFEFIKPYIEVYAPNRSVDRDQYMLCVGHDAYEIPKEIYDLFKEVLL